MMFKSIILSSSIVLLIATGLVSCRPIISTDGTGDFTLELLERDFVFLPDANAQLMFADLLTDSRCPLDVECVTAGEAAILLRILRADTITEFVLEGHVGPDGLERESPVFEIVEGFRFDLLKLDPYPRTDAGNNEIYRATLRVRY